jgi:hypothetical protein
LTQWVVVAGLDRVVLWVEVGIERGGRRFEEVAVLFSRIMRRRLLEARGRGSKGSIGVSGTKRKIGKAIVSE